MAGVQGLQRLKKETRELQTQHTHRKTETLSPTPHYPLLGVFVLTTLWQCQMSPQQGGENCYLNPSSPAGVSSRASHQTTSPLNTQCNHVSACSITS